MDDDTRTPSPRGTPRPPTTLEPSGLEALLLRILTRVERTLLYVVAFVLLAVAGAIVVMMFATAISASASWADTVIGILEELLLVLIVIEIFVTVQTHLKGRHLQADPFIIVGVIAVVRHILSVVVRLSVTMTAEQSREEFTELAVYAGVTLVLVLALALARWSKRRPAPGSRPRRADRQDSRDRRPPPS
ncbi:phosphate-starvation-inducible PsiE family protein [Microtetraspora fusca]|uniref:Phosphate-starvation-inducible PsiE family protein n=1 Tax=Microtetraspora fusca TaxID=1997 RepID=A0ABW6VFQ4_MICFU|nr:phosphate-starvation-inducible PsiE family protein [Microtetraspora fusca]